MGQPSVGVGVDQFGTYGAGGIVAQLQRHARGASLGDDVAGQRRRGADRRGGHVPEPRRAAGTGASSASRRPMSAELRLRVSNRIQTDSTTFVEQSAACHPNQPRRQRHHTVSVQPRHAGGVQWRRAADRLQPASSRPIGSRDQRPADRRTGGGAAEPRLAEPRRTGSAALVYDTSIYGATGPIVGQRYRLELSAGRLAR